MQSARLSWLWLLVVGAAGCATPPLPSSPDLSQVTTQEVRTKAGYAVAGNDSTLRGYATQAVAKATSQEWQEVSIPGSEREKVELMREQGLGLLVRLNVGMQETDAGWRVTCRAEDDFGENAPVEESSVVEYEAVPGAAPQVVATVTGRVASNWTPVANDHLTSRYCEFRLGDGRAALEKGELSSAGEALAELRGLNSAEHRDAIAAFGNDLRQAEATHKARQVEGHLQGNRFDQALSGVVEAREGWPAERRSELTTLTNRVFDGIVAAARRDPLGRAAGLLDRLAQAVPDRASDLEAVRRELREAQYTAAQEAIRTGNLDRAESLLRSLGDYRDSAQVLARVASMVRVEVELGSNMYSDRLLRTAIVVSDVTYSPPTVSWKITVKNLNELADADYQRLDGDDRFIWNASGGRVGITPGPEFYDRNNRRLTALFPADYRQRMGTTETYSMTFSDRRAAPTAEQVRKVKLDISVYPIR